jgi:TetR/AcrR family transcriptional regulator
VAQGERRDAILAAARSEFAQGGYAGARIERIAAAAGVNKQLIFHYFRSKDGLYSSVVSAIFASGIPTPDGAVSASERLRRVISQLVHWLHDNHGATRVISETDLVSATRPDTWVVVSRWLADAHGAVRSAVAAGQSHGHFRDDADPGVVADLVVSSALGHAMTGTLASDTSNAGVQRHIDNISRAMVEYCAWR